MPDIGGLVQALMGGAPRPPEEQGALLRVMGRQAPPIVPAAPGEPVIQSRVPSWQEQMASALMGDKRRSLGQDRFVNTMSTIAGMTPLGALSANSPQEAAMAILPGAGGPMGREALGAAKAGIRAYHGSPHSFDRFVLSPQTIGTGEGAQAYGHGLYFAGNEDIARGYRDRLAPFVPLEHSPGWFTGSERWFGENTGDISSRITERLKQVVPEKQSATAEQIAKAFADERAQLQQIKGGMRPILLGKLDDFERQFAAANPSYFRPEVPGHMYEVNINARPEQFLDWDKPLAQQPAIQGQLEQNASKLFGQLPWDQSRPMMPTPGSTGREAYQALYSSNRRPERTAKQQWEAAAPATSQALREAGIPGIQYLDAGSRLPKSDFNVFAPRFGSNETQFVVRGPGDVAHGRFNTREEAAAFADAENARLNPQTHNYVVFDDSLIDILRKYGIGLGIMAPGAAAVMGGQQDQQ